MTVIKILLAFLALSNPEEIMSDNPYAPHAYAPHTYAPYPHAPHTHVPHTHVVNASPVASALIDLLDTYPLLNDPYYMGHLLSAVNNSLPSIGYTDTVIVNFGQTISVTIEHPLNLARLKKCLVRNDF